MDKIDLKKQHKALYQPSAKKVELIEVPELLFVMIDGRIAPGETPGTSTEFQESMGALYSAAYTLKFASKLRKENPIDYGVMGLEALWSVESGELDIAHPENWSWTGMILQPEHITPEMFQAALAQARRKRPNPALERLRLERFCEGLCIQTMHIGPYADEPATLARMQAFAAENSLTYRGRHHEIYFGDPRRTAPDKLKTVLRQPVERQ